MRITKSKVLKALKEAGFDCGLWYDKSAQQWVFTNVNWFQTGSAVYRLSDLSLQKWVETAQIMSED